MISPSLQSTIDNLITNVLSQLATLQPGYLSSKARYWQGLPTHTIIPADGLATAPNLLSKPTYQAETWLTFGLILPALMECSLSVSQYSGPSGKGYVLHADAISSGVRYRRSENVGPAAWLSHPWTAMKTVVMS